MIKVAAVITALFGFLYAGWFAELFDDTPTPPITMPIDLYKAGSKVEFTTRIKKRRRYRIWLEFIWTDEVKNGVRDSDISRKIAGFGWARDKNGTIVCNKEDAIKYLALRGVHVDKDYDCFGTVVPLHVTIYKLEPNKEKKLIIDKTYQTKGTDGGWRYHMRRSVSCFLLEPGTYKVIVENIKSIKEMKGRKADIYFGVRVYK
jgi:hypothetical protein